jgi:hypothetical protein
MAPSAAKKQQSLTFKQLANYDDILTDALVDHVRATLPQGSAFGASIREGGQDGRVP